MNEKVYFRMNALEKAKRIPILLLLLERNRMKISDIGDIIKEKTKSGSPGTITVAMRELTKQGLVKEIIRNQTKGHVDYELTNLGRRVAEKLKGIVKIIKETG